MLRGASAWLDVVILAKLIKANAAHELIDWTAKPKLLPTVVCTENLSELMT